MTLRHLDCFSGMGGFSLGMERTGGFKTVGFCEIDPFCRSVLRQHWPDVPIYNDVTKLARRIHDCEPETDDGEVRCPRCGIEFGECECIGTDHLIDEVGFVNVITAGFECQDISIANWTGSAGIGGERSGLWSEIPRIGDQLRPDYIVLENSPEIVSRGLGTVLGDLAEIGYDAEWCCVPVRRWGAPHYRERWYAVAYPAQVGHQAILDDTFRQYVQAPALDWEFAGVAIKTRGFWATEPAPAPVDDGLPAGVVGPCLAAIGNSVSPQVVEAIGRAILRHSMRLPANGGKR